MEMVRHTMKASESCAFRWFGSGRVYHVSNVYRRDGVDLLLPYTKRNVGDLAGVESRYRRYLRRAGGLGKDLNFAHILSSCSRPYDGCPLKDIIDHTSHSLKIYAT